MVCTLTLAILLESNMSRVCACTYVPASYLTKTAIGSKIHGYGGYVYAFVMITLAISLFLLSASHSLCHTGGKRVRCT